MGERRKESVSISMNITTLLVITKLVKAVYKRTTPFLFPWLKELSYTESNHGAGFEPGRVSLPDPLSRRRQGQQVRRRVGLSGRGWREEYYGGRGERWW